MIANNNKSKLNCDSFICDMVKFLTKLPQFHNKIQHLHMVTSRQTNQVLLWMCKFYKGFLSEHNGVGG